MNDLKEFILNKLEELHLKLNYKSNYDLNTSNGLTKRIEDLAKYEQLLEVVRNNPEWQNEQLGVELAERIKKKTTLWR